MIILPTTPDMPQPRVSLPVPLHAHWHQLPAYPQVVAQAVLGGLHHAYGWEQKAG
jgi:hypothetical protein